MKILPYYVEDVGAKYSGAISLLQNTDVLSEDDARLFGAYMSSGIVVDEWLSNTVDIVTKKILIPTKTLSDGEYFWDFSHVYYVQNYRARLPQDFVSIL